MQETQTFWRHPRFADLGLIDARFIGHRYDRHTHPTYVIALITDGCERIRIGRQTVLAPAGTIAVVNPEEWHDGEAGADGGWAYRTFYPSVALLSSIAAELGSNGAPAFSRRLIEDAGLARALALAHAASRGADGVAAETSLLRAVSLLVRRYGSGGDRSEPSVGSGAARRFAVYEAEIAAHLADDLDLQRLADAGGVTRFQVIRDFRKIVGLSPAAFIRDRRLRHAGGLIRQGVGLADAALASGFADQAHLSRTFRAMLGITPGMFRAGWHAGGAR